MRAYVINLDRSADRLAHIRQQFAAAGAAFIRVPGIDDAEPRGCLSARERGCFLAHVRAWERLFRHGDRFAAVFEDDVHVARDLADLLRSDRWIPADADIVRLEANQPMKLSRGRAIPGLRRRRRVRRMRSRTWGSGGYLLSRAVAQRLLAAAPSADKALDGWLFDRPPFAMAAYQVTPAVCIQHQLVRQDGLPSLIGGEERRLNPPRLKTRVGRLSRLLPNRKRPVVYLD